MPDKGFEQSALERIGAQLDPMADAMASTMGLPPGGTRYSKDDEALEWNASPIASPDQRVQAMLELKAAGKTNEEITDLVYPNRRRLIMASRPKIADQLAFAKDMAKRMQKAADEMGMPPSPGELMPPTPAPMEPAAPAPVPPSIPTAQADPMTQPSILDQPISVGVN